MTHISVIPRPTEKAYTQITDKNTYLFDVPLEVKVAGIKTLVQQGKAVRFTRGKNRYPGTTKRKDSKKAYVKLAEGSSIQVFDQPAESEKK